MTSYTTFTTKLFYQFLTIDVGTLLLNPNNLHKPENWLYNTMNEKCTKILCILYLEFQIAITGTTLAQLLRNKYKGGKSNFTGNRDHINEK